jgi:hypothetical protein
MAIEGLIQNDPQQGLLQQLLAQNQLSPFSQGVKNFSTGAQGLAGLFSAFNANKLRKLGEKQFGAELALGNRNLSNTATATNADSINRAEVGLSLAGINKGDPRFQAEIDRTKGNFIDGSPIG